jgi:single-strand DNA-binding protein
VNHVVLIGRSAGEVRVRYSKTGQPVATFGLAVVRPGRTEVDFLDVVAFNKLAEVLAAHLERGRLIGVKGRLKTRQYEDGGRPRRVMEVVAENVRFLDAPRARREREEVAGVAGVSG